MCHKWFSERGKYLYYPHQESPHTPYLNKSPIHQPPPAHQTPKLRLGYWIASFRVWDMIPFHFSISGSIVLVMASTLDYTKLWIARLRPQGTPSSIWLQHFSDNCHYFSRIERGVPNGPTKTRVVERRMGCRLVRALASATDQSLPCLAPVWSAHHDTVVAYCATSALPAGHGVRNQGHQH